MKQLYFFLFICLQVAFVPLRAQQLTAAFKDLASINAEEQTEASTFLTMESVRHGMSGALKGIQVSIINPLCASVPAYIALTNPTGESWKYAVYSSSGQICSEGETGYDRRISLNESGTYLIRFTHVSGVIAFDELTVRKPTPSMASIELETTPIGTTGQNFQFKASCPTATEFTWEMGDGTVYYGKETIEHVYKTPGEYKVLLKANNWDCETVSEKLMTVGAQVAGTQSEN